MKTVLLLICSLATLLSPAQKLTGELSAAMNKLEKDEQFKHAILGMYVVNSKTGAVVYEKNAQLGLAPASCQKVITSVSAFELLGKNYRYKTQVVVGSVIRENDPVEKQPDEKQLFIEGSGDPTFGSWRYPGTIDTVILDKIYKSLVTKRIKDLRVIRVNDFLMGKQNIPGGWPWEDVGNYYGAGHYQLNWKENQYDVVFLTEEPLYEKYGSKQLKLKAHYEFLPDGMYYDNAVTAGPKNSGDNAYIYYKPASASILMAGTVPIGQKTFTIAGAMPDPAKFFIRQLENYFSDPGHSIKRESYGGIIMRDSVMDYQHIPWRTQHDLFKEDTVCIHYSPPFDSINYWFLKKSINLYGEAFVKTIAYEKKKFGSTDTGLAIIRDFWKSRGIEPSAIKIIDGSGLSPANRVTTNALVTVMQYAKTRDWFPSFYNALPEMNGIKMKDGYIGGVRSYTGYIKSKDGNEYTFSLIVNNFDGSPGTVREKMWRLLDLMK